MIDEYNNENDEWLYIYLTLTYLFNIYRVTLFDMQ